jgi:hypothetical protein
VVVIGEIEDALLSYFKEEYCMSVWFDDLPVLGKLPPEQAVAKLREVGENEVADKLVAAQLIANTVAKTREQAPQVFGDYGHWWAFEEKPYQYTSHIFGYIAPDPTDSEVLPIVSASRITADSTLKNSRVKITLDRLHVASYPGRGTHRILLHFFAQNQVSGKTEDVHFSTTYKVREGGHAAIESYPIFIGLNIKSEGMAFKCRTINVKNDQDEQLLGILESKEIKAGLHLAATVQPAIVPLSAMAMGLAEMIATRNNNISVQDFELGLDFSRIPTRSHLAQGSYLAVQVPKNIRWNWNEWGYHRDSEQIVSRVNPEQDIPYNYLIFSISRYEGQ